MIKVVFLAKRVDGMDHEECIKYWKEEHASIVQDLPGLEKYTLGVPLDPAESEWDGVAELYFEAAEDVQAAFESEAGERMLEDGAKFTKTEPRVDITVEELTLYEE